ncbi:MAG: ABC transporter permease [Paracoccaceae bacterium]|nr:ABC transporter permease [Paracoccaceae bacterium]
MDFLVFLVKRAAMSIPLLLGISIVSFAIIQAVPGDFVDGWIANTAAQTGKSYDELLPQAEAMRQRLGLDQTIVVQYLTWLKNIVFHFDFGMSFEQNRPVTDVLGTRLPRTLLLAVLTLVIGQVFGVLLGIYAATNQYKLGDNIATLITFMGIVIPKFVISLVILYFLAIVWHSPYIGAVNSPQYILQDSWNWAKFWDFLKHVWPILLVSIWAGQAYTTRMMRGNLLDVMNMQYIETARAKGLSRRKVLFKHAVPNALHPVIMNLGTRFDYMIKGEIEIAIVLGIPTVGPLILSAVGDRDMYVVAAIFMMVAVLLVLGNLFADLMLALLDPRVRRATMSRS